MKMLNCDLEGRKLAVSVRKQSRNKNLPASAHRLRVGLERRAPKVNLITDVRIISNNFEDDLLK